jgi:hypothetical protein
VSAWNLVWIVPVILVGMLAFASLWWRFLNWTSKNHRETVDRLAEFVFPGITGKGKSHQNENP